MPIPGYSQKIEDLQEIVAHLDGLRGEVAMYCQNPACTVREIVVTVKPYGEDIPHVPVCPFCQVARLVFSYVRNREEMHRHRIADATAVVGAALTLARIPGEFSTLPIICEATMELRRSLKLNPYSGFHE